MQENIVHITVGCIFDLYVKDSIKKETYDDCIRAYKEYIQSKDNVSITSNVGESVEKDYALVKPFGLPEKPSPDYREAYERMLYACEQFIGLFGSEGASDEAIDLFKKKINRVQKDYVEGDK